MAGELNSAASFGLNRFGSKITQKLPSPIRNIAGAALNFRRFKEPHLSYKWEFSLPKLNFKGVPESSKLGSYIPTVIGCSVPFLVLRPKMFILTHLSIVFLLQLILEI